MRNSISPQRPNFQTLKLVFHGHLPFASMVTLLMSSLLFQCGFDVEDPTPPSPPVWVEKSLPEEWPERGIDAHESGGIYLEWEPSPDGDVIAYNIYRTTWYHVNDSLGDYDMLSSLNIDTTPELKYVDNAVNNGTTYYYKLKSMGGTNNLGDFSESSVYSLLPKLEFSSMSPNGTNSTLGSERLLSWSYGYHIEMEDYCLTVLTEENEYVTRKRLLSSNYVGGAQSWQIPIEILLDSGQVYRWRVDIGARYMDGRETAGSESHWATFLYLGE